MEDADGEAGVVVRQEGGDNVPGPSGEQLLQPVKVEAGVTYEPISVSYLNEAGLKKYKYKCPLCVAVCTTNTCNGMRSHIREIHTGVPYLCTNCDTYSTFNPDSINCHENKCGGMAVDEEEGDDE